MLRIGEGVIESLSPLMCYDRCGFSFSSGSLRARSPKFLSLFGTPLSYVRAESIRKPISETEKPHTFFWRWCGRVAYGRTLLTGDGYHMAKWIVSQAENETRTKNLNVVTTAARAGSKARRAGLFSDAARAGLPVKSF